MVAVGVVVATSGLVAEAGLLASRRVRYMIRNVTIRSGSVAVSPHLGMNRRHRQRWTLKYRLRVRMLPGWVHLTDL